MQARGPRYYARFNCIADKCEDTCCGHFRVAVDEPHYRAMEAAMAGESERFHAAIQPTGKPDPFALVVLNEQGYCRLLEGGLCSVHQRFGADVLGNACASYPRVWSELGNSLELSTELSCPEAARLCLLADDSMELVELDAATAPRGKLRQKLTPEAALLKPWLRHFEEVREVSLRLLGERAFPIASRLFFVAYLAHRLEPLLRRDSETVDAARVAAELKLLEQPGALQKLHDTFAATPVVQSPAPTILLVILSARLESPAPPAFRRLVESVVGRDLRAVGESPTGDPARDLHTLGPARLAQLHKARAQSAPPLDRYFEAWAKHQLHEDWHINSPSLLLHVQALLVRMAMVRWLLVGGAHDGNWERAAVEAVYTISRTIEHNKKLTDGIAQAIEKTRMGTLAHSVALLSF